MAVQSPPFVLQNSSHGSELVRREALTSLPFGSAGGVVPATPATSANLTAGVIGASDLGVTAPVSGMSVNIAAGQGYVAGTLGSGSGYGIGTGYGMPTVTLNGASKPTVATNAVATSVQLTTQGVYYCYNDNSAGAVNLAVASANGSNPRIDVVIAQVEDAAYSGSNNDWKLAVVTGTAAASPTVPSLPANALVLAYVWVPAAATSIVSADILDLRFAYNRNPYYSYMYRTASYTQAATTGTVFPFDTILSDLTGACTTGAAATYTCPVAGLYTVFACLSPTPTTGDRLGVGIWHNGTQIYQQLEIPDSTGGLNISATVPVRCNPADTIQTAFINVATNTVFNVSTTAACAQLVALLSPA